MAISKEARLAMQNSWIAVGWNGVATPYHLSVSCSCSWQAALRHFYFSWWGSNTQQARRHGISVKSSDLIPRFLWQSRSLLTFNPGIKCTYLLRLLPKGGEAGWSRRRILLLLVNRTLCYGFLQVAQVAKSPTDKADRSPPWPFLTSAQKPVVKIKNEKGGGGGRATIPPVAGKALFRKKWSLREVTWSLEKWN